MSLGPLFILPAAALRTSARVLRFLADTGEIVAMALNPAQGRPVRAVSRREEAPADQAVTPAVPALAVFDAATISALTAPRVIAALEGLSTTELRELYEHEAANRRRRTVLEAIEAALLPPAEALVEDLIDDTRPETRLVYSTQTPAAR